MKMSVYLVLAVMVLAVFPGVSFSQTPPESGPPPAVRRAEITPEKFDEAKAAALQRVERRMKMLSMEKSCIEAARNAEEMKKCTPGRMKRMGPKGMPQHGQ